MQQTDPLSTSAYPRRASLHLRSQKLFVIKTLNTTTTNNNENNNNNNIHNDDTTTTNNNDDNNNNNPIIITNTNKHSNNTNAHTILIIQTLDKHIVSMHCVQTSNKDILVMALIAQWLGCQPQETEVLGSIPTTTN